MKLKVVSYLIVFSFLTAMSVVFNAAKAQEERGFLTIKGVVLHNNKPLGGVNITVIRNQKIFSQTQTDKRGHFKLALEYFSSFTINLEKESFHPMFMQVNSRLPADLLPLWSTFEIKIPFFKTDDPDVNSTLLQEPFADVSFDVELRKFTDLNRDRFFNPLNPSPTTNKLKEIVTSPKTDIVTPNERKVEDKQDARKNLAEKRKQESELLEKVKNINNKGTTPTKSTVSIKPNQISEQQALKKETSRKMVAKKSEEMNLLFEKRFSQQSTANNIRTEAKREDGLFNSTETVTIFQNDVIIYEFKHSTSWLGDDEYVINKKNVLATEYYLKLKQFIK